MLAMKNGINKVAKKLKKQATYPNEIFQKNPYILFVECSINYWQDDKKKKLNLSKQRSMQVYGNN
jgi:hypothetical protein